MRDRVYKVFFALLPYLPVFTIFGLVLIAGCVAHASEPQQDTGTVRLTWETLATMYGPLGFWLIWELRQKGQREEKREKVEEERRKKDEEHRKEWTDLIQKNTEALVNVVNGMTLSHADDEKNRLATYKLAGEVKEVCVKMDSICDGLVRGTRVLAKDN